MPRLDRTGPLGLGPRTGWGLGPCGLGLGWRRMGLDRGWGLRPWTKKETTDTLKEEAEILKEELAEIEKEIKDLKA